MSIINGLSDQKGIQVLNAGIANNSTEAQHRTDILYHTNGNVYCVISQSFSNAVTQKRLYLYRSTDDGNTWTLITNLTTGSVDDCPTLIQLDITDPLSDIGIVFLRMASTITSSGTVYRMACDVDGIETVPADPITGSPTTTSRPCIIPLSVGYRIIYSAAKSSSNAVTIYENTSFSLNSWSFVGNVNVLNSLTPGYLCRLRKLVNGDTLAVFVSRTQLDGGSNANGLFDNVRTDLS